MYSLEIKSVPACAMKYGGLISYLCIMTCTSCKCIQILCTSMNGSRSFRAMLKSADIMRIL